MDDTMNIIIYDARGAYDALGYRTNPNEKLVGVRYASMGDVPQEFRTTMALLDAAADHEGNAHIQGVGWRIPGGHPLVKFMCRDNPGQPWYYILSEATSGEVDDD